MLSSSLVLTIFIVLRLAASLKILLHDGPWNGRNLHQACIVPPSQRKSTRYIFSLQGQKKRKPIEKVDEFQLIEENGGRRKGTVGSVADGTKTPGFGANILNRMTTKATSVATEALSRATVFCLVAVIVCGLGTVITSLQSMRPTTPGTAESTVLAASFTPAMVLFFACSISYGLLQLARAGSDDVNYSE